MKKVIGRFALLSINHAAKELKISNYLIRKFIYEGKIGVISTGKREKVPISELERFIEEYTVRAKKDHQRNHLELTPNDILVKPNRIGDSMEGEKIFEKLLEEIGDGNIN